MSYKLSRIAVSGANSVATATQQILFGPVSVQQYSNWTIHIENSATTTIVLSMQTSINQARDFEGSFPLGALDNTAALSIAAGGVDVRSINHLNSYEYITILGSATATIGSSNVRMFLLGKDEE